MHKMTAHLSTIRQVALREEAVSRPDGQSPAATMPCTARSGIVLALRLSQHPSDRIKLRMDRVCLSTLLSTWESNVGYLHVFTG